MGLVDVTWLMTCSFFSTWMEFCYHQIFWAADSYRPYRFSAAVVCRRQCKERIAKKDSVLTRERRCFPQDIWQRRLYSKNNDSYGNGRLSAKMPTRTCKMWPHKSDCTAAMNTRLGSNYKHPKNIFYAAIKTFTATTQSFLNPLYYYLLYFAYDHTSLHEYIPYKITSLKWKPD